jgi:hypothetical protein
MKATTDMVLTHDRKRIVPLGDPDGNPLYWVASKGEEIPGEVKKKAPSENKQRKPKEDK